MRLYMRLYNQLFNRQVQAYTLSDSTTTTFVLFFLVIALSFTMRATFGSNFRQSSVTDTKSIQRTCVPSSDDGHELPLRHRQLLSPSMNRRTLWPLPIEISHHVQHQECHIGSLLFLLWKDRRLIFHRLEG